MSVNPPWSPHGNTGDVLLAGRPATTGHVDFLAIHGIMISSLFACPYMETVQRTNSAARLRAVLEKAREQPDGETTHRAWSKVLGVDEVKPGDFFIRYGQLLELYQSTKHQVLELPGTNPALYTRQFPKIEKLLHNTNFGAQWSAFKTLIDDAVVHGLEFCAERIFELGLDPQIKEADLKQIRQEVKELITRVSASELEKGLKRFLLEHLQLIQDALTGYEISGPEGLRSAVERNIGATLMRRVQGEAGLEESKEGKAFLALLVKVANATAPNSARKTIDLSVTLASIQFENSSDDPSGQ